MLKCVVLLAVFWLQKEASAYNVALVEYVYDEQTFLDLSPIAAANKNAKKYDEIVEKLKKEQKELDIVVFPEGTLVGEPMNTPSGRLGMTIVPDAQNGISPCDSTDNRYSEFLKVLSCTAKKYNTYLVVNLKELDDEKDEMKFYNTDVVFDRVGRVIARYRKYNTYLEKDTNRPDVPELITFDTDFGKKFGIFTCFDILFEGPAIQLVKKGVKNFIFPTLWIPELPFLTTNQVQQMWAQGNDVTLLASGASLPSYGSGGLGIYMGDNVTLASATTPTRDNFYLVKNVPHTTEHSNSKCSFEVNEDNAKEMDKYKLHTENLTKYTYERLDLGESKTIKKQLCQNGLCCDFHIDVDRVDTEENLRSYEYFLIVRNGLRTYGRKTYRNALEVCGLIACTGATLKQCGKRFAKYEEISWPIVFKKIEISAVFKNPERNVQFPNSLLADFSPISPTCTSWTSETNSLKKTVRKTFSTETPVSKILTFAIFGRNYAEDPK